MGRANDPQERKQDAAYSATQRAAANLVQRAGARLEQLDRWLEDPPGGEVYITELRFRVGAGYDEGVLCIVKAQHGVERLVAFHGADTLLECISGLSSRLANGSLKWKEDIPYDSRTT